MQYCTVQDIFKGIDFSAEEADIVEKRFEEIIVKKGDVLLTPGKLKCPKS